MAQRARQAATAKMPTSFTLVAALAEPDEQGYLIALSDFPEPIGPGSWSRDRT